MRNIFFIICLMLFGGLTYGQNDNPRESREEGPRSNIQFEQKLAFFTKELNAITRSRASSESKKAAVLSTISDFVKDVTGEGLERDLPIEPKSDLGDLEGEKADDNLAGGGISPGQGEGESENLVFTSRHNKERIRNYFRELQMINKNKAVLTDYAKQSVGEMKDRDFAFAVAIYEEVGIDHIAPQDLCRGGACDKDEDTNGRIRGVWNFEGDAKYFMENNVWGYRYYCSYLDPLVKGGKKKFAWKKKSNVGIWK